MLSVRRMENGIYSMSDNTSSEDTLERVYTFIQNYLQQHQGLSPSFREIANGCYIASSNVIRHLDKLEGQGRILREQGQARSIRLPEFSEKNRANVRTNAHPEG